MHKLYANLKTQNINVKFIHLERYNILEESGWIMNVQKESRLKTFTFFIFTTFFVPENTRFVKESFFG